MPVQKITKPEIIRKAIDVFQRRGYHATSMSDLAEACGLMKGSFYHYFRSKEELMQAVLESVRAYYNQKVFAIAYDDALPPRERLVRIFRKQEPIITQNFAGCLFGNMTLETISTESEFRALLQGFFEDWLRAFEHLFAAAGYAPGEQARSQAQQAVMEIEGAIMMMRLYDNFDMLQAACLRVLDRLGEGLLTHEN